jgi:hypothetical protein
VGLDPVLVSSLALSSLALTLAFPPFRLEERHAPLLTVGEEETLPPHLTQHPFSLHLLSEALEQLFLRLALS